MLINLQAKIRAVVRIYACICDYHMEMLRNHSGSCEMRNGVKSEKVWNLGFSSKFSLVADTMILVVSALKKILQVIWHKSENRNCTLKFLDSTVLNDFNAKCTVFVSCNKVLVNM
jgi:hypothetical protein